MTRAAVFLLFCFTCLTEAARAQAPDPPDAREKFSFVIFGDRTGGRPDGVKVLDRAVTAANRLEPDFVMTVGDLVQGYGKAEPWLAQMKEYKAIMNKLRRPWYPVAGNHDVYGGRKNPGGNVDLYQKHFAPLWYSFDYRWGHFVVLFSDEHLSFRNPAKTQNMSKEQMDWLRADLKKTKAAQVYVFLHHPRWLYRGTNWPKVHKILAADGRVRAVFAGHIHVYRDDGVRDGVHYYTVAVTGGHAGGLKTPVALHHMNHVVVTKEGPTMSVLPVGAVVGANLALGREVDALNALRHGRWLGLPGGIKCAPKEAHESEFAVMLNNPAKTPVAYELRLELPKGWVGEPAFIGGQLGVGKTITQKFKVKAAPFTGRRPTARLRAILHHPLQSGLVHPVHHSRMIPLRVTGLPGGALAANKVLSLDGKSALMVDTGLFESMAFTLECWVKGPEPKGAVRALIAKTESSGFGLWWNGGDRERPYGVVGMAKLRRYLYAEASKPWEYGEWTHVAMCSGNGWLRLFINGKISAEHKLPGSRNYNPHPIYIGADPDRNGRGGRFFVGQIDEVRLSTIVRYEKAFRPKKTFARDEFTHLLFHFDQQAHELHPDDSGNDIHGWPVGKPALVAEKR